jgi:ribosomal protein L19
MMENNKRIIEINGIKLEVDLSTAKRIDEFRVGDNVKVLKNESGSFNVYAGVIVEFVNFKELPTMIIAVFKQDYWGSKLEFINFNAKSENVEITLCCEHELKLEKCRVLDKFNQEIEKKQSEIDDLRNKRDYFEKYFAKYFQPNS